MNENSNAERDASEENIEHRTLNTETLIGQDKQALAPPATARAWVWVALSAVLVVLILAASWAPDSKMTELRWLPRWITALADRGPNIRTAAPFIPLAFLLVHGLACSGFKRPKTWALGLCLACVILAESGQLFLPGRHCDGWDVLWGGVGAILGIGIAWMGQQCTQGLARSRRDGPFEIR